MPLRITWTAQADQLLLGLRRGGATWDACAAALGISRNAAIDRGKRVVLVHDGAEAAAVRVTSRGPRPEPTPETQDDRAPYPVGHPETWDALTRGTCMQGVPCPGNALVLPAGRHHPRRPGARGLPHRDAAPRAGAPAGLG